MSKNAEAWRQYPHGNSGGIDFQPAFTQYATQIAVTSACGLPLLLLATGQYALSVTVRTADGGVGARWMEAAAIDQTVNFNLRVRSFDPPSELYGLQHPDMFAACFISSFLQYVADNGKSIRYFAGDWVAGSVNLTQYYKAKFANHPHPEQATWTYTQAARHGFYRTVQVIEEPNGSVGVIFARD